jgi:hypothetical protein
MPLQSFEHCDVGRIQMLEAGMVHCPGPTEVDKLSSQVVSAVNVADEYSKRVQVL